MEEMPRPRKQFLHKETTRHNTTVWYVRRGKGKRIRLKAKFGTDEFWAEYDAAIDGKVSEKQKTGPNGGTVEWLISRYRDSGAWASLAPATRLQRDFVYKTMIASVGKESAKSIDREDLQESLLKRRDTPFAAKTFVKAMRGLFKWAKEAKLLETDPSLGLTARTPKTGGYHVWTDDEIAKFEKRWPLGTRENLALALCLYTGARRQDAVRLGRQHVRDGLLSFRPLKTPEVEVNIPILPELRVAIDATKTGDLVFIANLDGTAKTVKSFGTWFKRACRAAKVPGSAHGLRKAGATRAADNGATERQLNAIYGWAEGSRESATYTRNADRKKLARDGIQKLKSGTSIPSPYDTVREPEKKAK